MEKSQEHLKEKESLGITGRVRVVSRDSKTGEICYDSGWFKNLIVFSTNHGKDLVLRRLIGDNSYSLNIQYAELGTGSTTPTVADTTLTTPIARAAYSLRTITSNVASFQFFFPDGSLANNTYNEFGVFVDGSLTLSSGQMFNHALFTSPYVKASGKDTTVQLDITIN